MVKKILEKIKSYHFLSVLITLSFLLFSIFLFNQSYWRIIESSRDFGLSIAYYFCELFEIKHSIRITVNELPELPASPIIHIPSEYSDFSDNFGAYLKALISKNNAKLYINTVTEVLFYIFQIVLIIMPLMILINLFFKRHFKHTNNNYNQDTKPLKLYKKSFGKFFDYVKNFIIRYIDFIKNHKSYFVLWLLIWLYNFRILVILLEFIAFYLYFIVSFDVVNIYRQVYKLFIDLSIIPVWIWVIGLIFLFLWLRLRIGYNNLRHMENRNKGFINERNICSMLVGTMGAKKTSLLTDISLSQEVIFRNKAFEKILEWDLKFPHFPYINLEREIKNAVNFHQIYNLATCRIWADKKKERWIKNQCFDKCFGYDYVRYNFDYDDKLQVIDVWKMIEVYTQLYFIYIIQSSLIISNYSVRTDMLFADMGNFPLWNGDFFERDSRLIDSYSRHAHILDFDMLRLGKKVIDGNKRVFDFGIINITEIGKERGNQIELQGVKKQDENTNQRNDLFNLQLKMIRHAATVDNYCFAKVYFDEQRPESLGADGRELCDILHIKKVSDLCLAMPFFFVEEFIYEFIFGRFVNLYSQYRFNRADNTLFMYLIKKFVSLIVRHYKRIYNVFGYYKVNFIVETTLDKVERKYFLMTKKVYSKRFATDAFADYFAEVTLKSNQGLNDLLEYQTEKATFEELQAQNSYFIRDLMKFKDKKETINIIETSKYFDVNFDKF